MKNLRGMDRTNTPKNLALTERQWSYLEGIAERLGVRMRKSG
jgi:hypothetical protein